MFKKLSILLIILCNSYLYNNNKIIVMTGPSCAGKSTLSEIFKKIFFAEDWYVINFGTFRLQILNDKAKELDLVSQDYINENNIILDQEVQKRLIKLGENDVQQKRDAWNQVFDLCDSIFFQYLDDLCKIHKNILIDIPLYSKNTFSCLLNSKLKNYNTFFVFVHVPFEKLLERVDKRNKRNNDKEYRYMNQVIYRYFLYYRVVLQKNNRTLEEFSKTLLKKNIVEWTQEKKYFVTLPTSYELADYILGSLKFDQEKMFLEPKLNYDCIIDTNKYTPEDAALLLHNKAFQSSGTHLFENIDMSIF